MYFLNCALEGMVKIANGEMDMRTQILQVPCLKSEQVLKTRVVITENRDCEMMRNECRKRMD